MSNIYTPQDVEIISQDYLKMPLDELSKRLGRNPYGVAVKMRSLARENRLDREIVWEYTRAEIKANQGDVSAQKKRWKAKQRLVKLGK